MCIQRFQLQCIFDELVNLSSSQLITRALISPEYCHRFPSIKTSEQQCKCLMCSTVFNQIQAQSLHVNLTKKSIENNELFST
jgi:hypothetical protein